MTRLHLRHRVLTIWAMVLISTLISTVGSTVLAQSLDKDQLRMLNRHVEEFETYPLMLELSRRHQPQTIALVGVNLVSMTGAGMREDQTVIIRDSRFQVIGDSAVTPVPEDARIIDGLEDHFLIPGLTEAHAHTQFSMSQFLVYLTRGVTTVREMGGFSWMLDARQMAAENKLLIPNLYLAGHILSSRAWDFYMTQVDTEEQVRYRVAEQAAAGYDFIKIHNSLEKNLYTALFDEAGKHGLDVIGHIPQEISIAEAVEAGQRTNEHFKGYIFDGDLSITDQDYVEDTEGSEMWHAPTFSNYHDHLRGAQASRLAEAENSLRLVPGWLKASWAKQASMPVDGLTGLRQTIYPKSREIFSRLSRVTDRFIAGTDTGGYAYQVPGYALLEEVRIFESLGLSPYQALETATINSARAMRKEQEMGTIEVGKRADFVMLSKNPLLSSAHLSAVEGVGVRGIWLDRSELDRIESRLEQLFSGKQTSPGSPEIRLKRVLKIREEIRTAGFPLPAYLDQEVEELRLAMDLDSE